MRKKISLLLIFTLLTSNLYADMFNIRYDIPLGLIDIAKQSEDMKEYISYVVDKQYYERYFIIKQDNSVFIKTPKFNRENNDFINLLFSSYCTALGGKFNGGDYLLNENIKGEKVFYSSPFNCFDNIKKRLFFKTESDGNKINSPTYIEVIFKPEYIRDNYINAIKDMKRSYKAEQSDIGFFGKDNFGNYIIYHKNNAKLFFRYKNRSSSNPFSDSFAKIIGHINYGSFKNYHPLFISSNFSIKGDDCMMRDGNIFIYPDGYCEVTFNNVIFINIKTSTLTNATYLSSFGEFIINPMTEE